MDAMLETIESMQRHYGLGEAYSLPRRKIIGSGGMLAVMGGGLYYDGVLGVKTYTVVKVLTPRSHSSWLYSAPPANPRLATEFPGVDSPSKVTSIRPACRHWPGVFFASFSSLIRSPVNIDTIASLVM